MVVFCIPVVANTVAMLNKSKVAIKMMVVDFNLAIFELLSYVYKQAGTLLGVRVCGHWRAATDNFVVDHQ